MTSLHYTLIALGIGLVGAVMLYNFWQERRSRKQAERLFQPVEHDEPVSLGDLPLHEDIPETRIEPRIQLLDDVPAGEPVAEPEVGWDMAVEPEPVPFAAASEPLPEPAAGEPAAPVVAEAPVAPGVQPLAPESPLDAEVEYVARLRYTQPTTVQFAALQDGLRRISKPIRMVGRREDGGWEAVMGHAARAYDTVEMGLLLADRAGPVSEVQLETFCRRLYEFATEHGGAISCQDKAEAVERAKALDGFCAEVDMLIGLNVIPSEGGFANDTVNELAVQAGLEQGADGTYVLKDAARRPLFTLTDGGAGQDETAHGVSLLFDVPRVADGLAAFDRMTELGLALAERLHGHLVDDGGRPVSRASLERDRRSLEAIYARMAGHGVPAGGERALRLFA
ncbi:hypothetical protein EZJ19_08120 [Parasulfuritortus cantonensis]|uniref:Cell division protein ZipA n=1 Tax=Parasulfuritortus cantonensis TaxID=2528202 RepID=A0A4R1BD75_9PROT|nr:cell division protein ZipA C-terminal FtsZ-binding domain-containing protein [Parasulfuritortus cantonensis]TCJ15019.1 hypothetical protein EZJ19_08120 [Parasulfuritortus cantonensis]